MSKVYRVAVHVLGLVFFLSVGFQMYHYSEFSEKVNQFAAKGPRFTANDGQVLCERIKNLEDALNKLDPEKFASRPGTVCEYTKK